MGDTNGPLSRQRLLLEAARRDGLTLWQLCLLNAGPRGHLLTIGTPQQIADTAAFLASDRAGALTSQMVNASCGLVAG